MNFKQIILEALTEKDIEVISVQVDAYNPNYKEALLRFKDGGKSFRFYLTDNPFDSFVAKNDAWYVITKIGLDSEVGTSRLLFNLIKNWEFKQKLTPQTKETFGDLIDEL
jgi:hypothetical protein